MAEKPGRLNLLSSQELNLTLTIQRRLNEGLSISLTLWREHLLGDQLQKKKKKFCKNLSKLFPYGGLPRGQHCSYVKVESVPSRVCIYKKHVLSKFTNVLLVNQSRHTPLDALGLIQSFLCLVGS